MPSSGFDDARARVQRAAAQFEELRARLEGSVGPIEVTSELRVDIAQIIDHLRAALDYCAQELYARYGEPPEKGREPKVYFPIVKPSGDFRSVLGKCIPGIIRKRPDLADLLLSMQVASHTGNQWLADLGALANENKHVRLTLQSPDLRRALRLSDGPTGGFIIPEGRSVTFANIWLGPHYIRGPVKVDVDHPPPSFTGVVEVLPYVALVWHIAKRKLDVMPFLLTATQRVASIIDAVRAAAETRPSEASG